MLLDSVAYYHLAIACTPLPHTAIMSSDYEISDDDNEYYDEEDDEMEVDYDDGAHTLVYTRPVSPTMLTHVHGPPCRVGLGY